MLPVTSGARGKSESLKVSEGNALKITKAIHRCVSALPELETHLPQAASVAAPHSDITVF